MMSNPRSVMAVHPRVCGERVRALFLLLWDYGSSPRVRGTLSQETLKHDELTVHPRVCGERYSERPEDDW